MVKLTRIQSIGFLAIICIQLAAVSTLFAQEKEAVRIDQAHTVITEFATMNESIPTELISITQGIIIVPKMLNAGFVIGGKRGRGVAMIKKADGSWSNPLFVTLTGGSFGLQAGVQSVDLVLIFRHSISLTAMKKNSFTLGGDLSVSAGPLGRSSSANTDYKLDAEVYSYSRSRGLFAGISLNGASLNVDEAANKSFYRTDKTVSEIFTAASSNDPEVAQLRAALGAMK